MTSYLTIKQYDDIGHNMVLTSPVHVNYLCEHLFSSLSIAEGGHHQMAHVVLGHSFASQVKGMASTLTLSPMFGASLVSNACNVG